MTKRTISGITRLATLALLTAVVSMGQNNLVTRAHQSEHAVRGRALVPTAPVGGALDRLSVSDSDESLAALKKIRVAVAAGKPFRVDIAENGTRFSPDETPAFPDGLPAYGAEFITEGYIYPAGTLTGPNGANPDGSPEFPNRVIGRWVCRG